MTPAQLEKKIEICFEHDVESECCEICKESEEEWEELSKEEKE